jgi:hypothetical protein
MMLNCPTSRRVFFSRLFLDAQLFQQVVQQVLLGPRRRHRVEEGDELGRLQVGAHHAEEEAVVRLHGGAPRLDGLELGARGEGGNVPSVELFDPGAEGLWDGVTS